MGIELNNKELIESFKKIRQTCWYILLAFK